jgi:hypothetical protein
MDAGGAAQIARAIEDASGPDWVDVVTLVANLGVLATAWLALTYARSQVSLAAGHLRAVADTATAAARGERGRFLFSLDSVFESRDFLAGRKGLMKLRDGFVTAERITAEVDRLRGSNDDAELSLYGEIVAVFRFFESLGFFARRRMIDVEEVADLYGPSLREIESIAGELLRRDARDDPALWDNLLWLLTAAKAPEVSASRSRLR